MGWTYYNSTHLKPNGEVDRKKELDNEFRNDYTVLKSTMVGTTYYAAVKKEATGEVFGYVALTSSDKRGGYNFGYKTVAEDSKGTIAPLTASRNGLLNAGSPSR